MSPAGRNLGVEPLALWRQFLGHWPPFLGVHLAVSLLSFVLLTPLAAALLRVAVSLSGDAALSDQDILFFVLSPGGFLAFLLLGSLFSVIAFLGHAAMLVLALTVRAGQPASVRQVLLFLGRRGTAVFELALRILLRVLLNLLPFVLLALLLYRLLLTEYDINYYLAEKPPEWRLALAGGALIGVAGVANLLRLFVNWLLCLPLMLFTGVAPGEALARSHETVRGHRRALLGWLLAWLLATLLAGLLTSGLVGLAGNLLMPLLADSVDALLLALGLFAFLGVLLAFAVSLASSAWLSLFIVQVAESLGLRWERKPGAATGQARDFLSSPRVLVAGLAAGVLTAVVLSWALVQRLPMEAQAEIMAHRGASGSAP